MSAVYSYLLNVQISIIGQAPAEIVQKIRDEVRTGGGSFEQKLTKDTTHAILVSPPEQVQPQIESAVDFGAVVVERRWLEVCSNHRQVGVLKIFLALKTNSNASLKLNLIPSLFQSSHFPWHLDPDYFLAYDSQHRKYV